MTPEKANEMNAEVALNKGREHAFPLSTGSGYPSTGMTKREYMATQIMTGFLAHGHAGVSAAQKTVEAVDALLIALHTTK